MGSSPANMDVSLPLLQSVPSSSTPRYTVPGRETVRAAEPPTVTSSARRLA